MTATAARTMRGVWFTLPRGRPGPPRRPPRVAGVGVPISVMGESITEPFSGPSSLMGVSATPAVVSMILGPGVDPAAEGAVRSASVGAGPPRAGPPRARPDRRTGVFSGGAFLRGDLDFDRSGNSSSSSSSPSPPSSPALDLGRRRGRLGNMPRSSAPAIFGVDCGLSRSPVPRGTREMPRNSTRCRVLRSGR